MDPEKTETPIEGLLKDDNVPLYSYMCSKCMKYYEYLVKLAKSDEEIKCPHCGEPLKKLMDTPYFTIK